LTGGVALGGEVKGTAAAIAAELVAKAGLHHVPASGWLMVLPDVVLPWPLLLALPKLETYDRVLKDGEALSAALLSGWERQQQGLWRAGAAAAQDVHCRGPGLNMCNSRSYY
jgi:hypothetical protein